MLSFTYSKILLNCAPRKLNQIRVSMSNKIKHIYSEIINNKKQLILKVDQTSDFVYPNEPYKYQIYCKNVSGDVIENVRIQVLNPSTIAINEDDAIPPEGIEIGNLNNGQSHLLYLKNTRHS